jgi:environmental stress-induced protein Ves
MNAAPTSERLQLIPAHEYRRERWRNDCGWTREIYRQPLPATDPATAHAGDHGNDWAWRLSIAEIEQHSPFSAFPGIDRELVLLQGHGLHLHFDDGETIRLDPPHGRHRFAGERALRGEPIDGPTHDFNLMWRRDTIDAAVWHRPLVGSMVLFVEPGECWVVHVLSGHAQAADGALRCVAAMADTLLLRAQDARARFALEGGGEILVIRLRALEASS